MTPAEAAVWTPTTYFRALSRNVLVVAVTRIEGSWKAYCDSVPGQSHRAEQELVMERGTALPEDTARTLFPFMSEVPYAR